MRRSKFVSILAILLAVIMALSLILSVLPAAFAIDESDIEQMQREREELASQADEAHSRLEQLQAEEANVLEQKAALEVEIEASEKALALVGEEIKMYNQMIADKRVELSAAQAQEAGQAAIYRARVRAIEENGGVNILVLILRSSGLSQLLTALDDAAAIMESDRALEAQYRAAREETERVTREYESVRDECEKKQSALRDDQIALSAKIDDVNAQLEALSAKIDEAKKEYEQQCAAEEAAAAEVQNLIAQLMEQRRREEEERQRQQQENQGGETGGNTGGETGGNTGGETGGESGGETGGETGGEAPGPAPTQAPAPAPTPAPTPAPEGWAWPVPCSSRITSRYGNRIDPFTGAVRYHSGIDIDGYAHDGYPIVAAKSGTVSAVNYNDGYGNYVIIDHGDGYMTLYAHMSGVAVSYGSWIGQGQTVGYLGATGRATGTHCHFEVYVWGSRTDPVQFYSWMNLSYWNC